MFSLVLLARSVARTVTALRCCAASLSRGSALLRKRVRVGSEALRSTLHRGNRAAMRFQAQCLQIGLQHLQCLLAAMRLTRLQGSHSRVACLLAQVRALDCTALRQAS